MRARLSDRAGRALRHAALSAALLVSAAGAAAAEPEHGIAMYGTPALPEGYDHLPYANPDAPKGGRIVMGEVGGFDSLNPFILKGEPPWQLGQLAYESLMGRNWDEPFSLYGLLAETIETGPDREWVEFTLRPEAHFSDGSPVTVEDVIWSFETLGTEGHPRYLGFWKQVAEIEQTGPRKVRLTFAEDNPELALLAGLRPILKKGQYTGAGAPAFGRSTLDDAPIGSAPYRVTEFEAGRYVELTRDPDYWGRDLAFRNGTDNFDTIRIEYFGDAAAMFEALKAGVISVLRETNADLWETRYDFPAAQRGDVVKSVIPHQRPSGMTGFVMNTRREIFADWRVRAAMILAFNFPYINDTMTGGRQPRITSYFSNSELGMRPGPAEGRVRDLLDPFADDLPPGTLEGYALPEGELSARNRDDLRRAMALLREAGWSVDRDSRRLENAAGEPFRFEVLLSKGSRENVSMMQLYSRALERLGIEMQVTVTDDAQLAQRTNALDFDMAHFRRGLSLSPGTEQRLYWGSEGADAPGSRNWMGVKSPAVDAMIQAMLDAPSTEDFIAATRALDRLLMAGRYVIPLYQWNVSRIAHAKELHYPEHLPIYGDWAGFLPDVWWWDEAE
ncbi:ABC transporter substrate-binding protein [Aquicoccus sp. SCR17]|nr:ABC transporter substrate-binding protein [Carideicomes alvinocaridis]